MWLGSKYGEWVFGNHALLQIVSVNRRRLFLGYGLYFRRLLKRQQQGRALERQGRRCKE